MGIDIKALPKPVRAFFNGIGQVVFIENVIAGAMIYVSFWIAGLENNAWNFGSWYSWRPLVFVTIGVNLANLVAYLIGADRDAITSGLFGFCPNLISIGACMFSGGMVDPAMGGGADYGGTNWWTAWIVMSLGCAICPMVQAFINKFTGHHGLPGFTFPFNTITWFFVAMSFGVDLLHFGSAPTLQVANTLPNGLTLTTGSAATSSWMTGFDWSTMGFDWGAMTPSHWGLFFINAFEEIYVIDGFIASLILMAAYFWYNWQFALKACLATAFAIGMGLLFGADMNANMGLALYGYSSILTVGALDTFCKSKINSGRYWFLYFYGLVMTSLVNFGLHTILGVFGMPNVTFAFVLTGWMMLILERFMIESKEAREAKKLEAQQQS
jgi:urea transporter